MCRPDYHNGVCLDCGERAGAPNTVELERATAFLAGSHYCDYIEDHPHKGCQCSCGLCFAFWHSNVWRYEQAERTVADVVHD